MNWTGIILALVLVGIVVYIVGTGTLSLESFKPKLNSIATLKDVTQQTNANLIIPNSTNGLNGFIDPHPANDPNLLTQNVLNRDLIDENVIRQNYNTLLSSVQLNLPTGNGQGVQTKTISLADALALFNAQGNAAFTKSLQQGFIKLVQDPTSGLIGASLTQETVNRAKSDPQLASALGIMQSKGLVGTG